jgi:uncharacterized protein YcbK (DUF882 family)
VQSKIEQPRQRLNQAMNPARRRFLKSSAQAAALWLCPLPVQAAFRQLAASNRNLSFYNTHTNETLDVRYFENGRYQSRALKRINYILRDHRTGDIHPIDYHLLDLLYAVSQKSCTAAPFHIISGYRSPATNAMLRKISKGVALHSLHIQGKAIDIRLPDCDTRHLKQIAMNFKVGGVGYYPASDFVHLDTGEVRYW